MILHYSATGRDNETCEQVERDLMVRPSPAAFWDDRLYSTHVPVISWAERGDDILSESNYLMVLEALEGRAVHDDGDQQESSDEYVIDATIGDWLVGSLRQVFVRTRDDEGNFTETFRTAVDILAALMDYPVYDESDFSEREWDAYEKGLDEAIEYAAHSAYLSSDEPDADEVVEKIKAATYELIREDGQWGRYEDVDWDIVSEFYDEARTAVLALA